MSDLIDRQYVLDKFKALCDACGEGEKYNGVMCRACSLDDAIFEVETVPGMVIIHCKDCIWWDPLEEDHPYGYCRACRSGTHTERWDISIYRTNRYDFFCADAEPKEDEEEEDEE